MPRTPKNQPHIPYHLITSCQRRHRSRHSLVVRPQPIGIPAPSLHLSSALQQLVDVDPTVKGNVPEFLPVVRQAVVGDQEQLGREKYIFKRTNERNKSAMMISKEIGRLTVPEIGSCNLSAAANDTCAFEQFFIRDPDEAPRTDVVCHERNLAPGNVGIASQLDGFKRHPIWRVSLRAALRSRAVATSIRR